MGWSRAFILNAERQSRFGWKSKNLRRRTKNIETPLTGGTPAHASWHGPPAPIHPGPGHDESTQYPGIVVGYNGYMPHFINLASNAFLLYFHQHHGGMGASHLFSSTSWRGKKQTFFLHLFSLT